MTPTAPTNPRENALGAYLVVTLGYWAFMLTDGALRMLVLLEFHRLGFHPVQLAYLFLLYEFMGIVTNLTAGWLAQRFGLTRTLYGGLVLQIGALLALAAFDPAWATAASVIFVMAVQGVSGVAKDLTKMSAKSAVKVLAPAGDDQGGLFRWVAVLTGSKNAVKGLGFLLGAALLAWFGFETAVLGMAAVLAVVLVLCATTMPPGLPVGAPKAKFREMFSSSSNVNRLSAARVFLFGARDVWFVVGIPIFFYSVLSDGTPQGDERAFFLIGSFMALWIIAYGAVQAVTPAVLGARTQPLGAIVSQARRWAGLLTLIPTMLAALAFLEAPSITAGAPPLWLTLTLVGGLLVFGGVFAINSSVHSYLILAFSTGERVALDVGFYYMANATGRLLGTLLSGLSYQLGGLPLCLGTAAVMAALSWLLAARLDRRFEAVPA